MSVLSSASRHSFSLEDLRELRKFNKDLQSLETTPVKAGDENLSEEMVKGKKYGDWAASAQKSLEFCHKALRSTDSETLSHLEKQIAKEEEAVLEKKLGRKLEKEEKLRISVRDDVQMLEEELVTLKCRARMGEAHVVQTSDLEKVLLGYRKSTDLYKDADEKRKTLSFSPEQRAQIQEVCEKFPLFAQLLIERNKGKDLEHLQAPDKTKKIDKEKLFDDLTARFVKWALRAETGWHQRANNVDVFVKMPMRTRDLMKINLDKRVGGISGGRGIEIKSDDGLEKLCLMIDGTYRNIMKGHEQDRYTLRNQVDPKARPVEVTIQEIFEGIKEKTKGYGEFDWFDGKGISLWNAIKLGCWNPDIDDGAGSVVMIDPNDPTCFESMPVAKTITREELVRLHEGQENSLPKDGEWGFALRSTRNKGLHVVETHGFCTLYQPVADGKYRVYSISLQATGFPITFKEQLEYLAKTCDAGIHYPDESSVLCQREHKMKMYAVSEEKIREAFIPRFQQFVRKAQANTLYFQPQGKNCAYNAHSFFDRVVGSVLTDKLKELAKANLSYSQTELKQIFTKAFKAFDEGALESLIEDLFEKLTIDGNLEEIGNIFNASMELLSKTLFKDDPKAAAAFEAIKNTYTSDIKNVTNKEELIFAMKKLVIDAIHSIQHFRIYLFDADFDNALNMIIDFIKSIPWKWLRDFVGTIVMFLLFLSWKTKTIIKKRMVDGVEVFYEKKVSLWNTNELERKHEFYLPASMWEWDKKQVTWQKTMRPRIEEAKKQLSTALGVKDFHVPNFFVRDITPLSPKAQ